MAAHYTAEYPREVLAERGEVLDRLRIADLPTEHGQVIDKSGTQSHEQGFSVSNNGQSAELFIVDTTGFEPGGYTDAYGLHRVRSVYRPNETIRLFTDPILYRRLDVTNPDGCPAIRVSFIKDNDEWQIAGFGKARFFADRLHNKDDSPEVTEMSDIERELEQTLGQWIQDAHEEHHLGFMSDRNGTFAAHRPLREWADFKNLQLLSHLLIDHSAKSVLTSHAHAAAQAHINGQSRLTSVSEAQEVLSTTTDIEMHLVTILSLPDVSKYMLSSEAFRHFCEAILSGKTDIRKIVGIGKITGLIQVETDDTLGGYQVTAGGTQMHVQDWEDMLITTLQRTDRSESEKIERDRRILAETHRRQQEALEELRIKRLLRGDSDRRAAAKRVFRYKRH